MPPRRAEKKLIKSLSFWKLFQSFLTCCFVTVILNNFYYLVYESFTHFQLESFVNFSTITYASIAASAAGTLLYIMLSFLIRRPILVFTFLIAIFTLVSCAYPLKNILPDGTFTPKGFALLTIPMHFITAFIILIIIPSSSSDNQSYKHS
jgi:hypothetical protein